MQDLVHDRLPGDTYVHLMGLLNNKDRQLSDIELYIHCFNLELTLFDKGYDLCIDIDIEDPKSNTFEYSRFQHFQWNELIEILTTNPFAECTDVLCW